MCALTILLKLELSSRKYVMAIDQDETRARFLQNHQGYSSAAWYIAKGGLSKQQRLWIWLLTWE